MTNHRVTSILLCALLSSTLGHEYLRVKRFAPEARKSILQSPFQERSSDPQDCSIKCTSGNQTDQLLLLFNQTTNLVGVVNVTASVALVIDVNANLVALFNGTNGDIVIINVETNTGVFITASDTNKVWLKIHESFEIYFRSLTSLQFFIDLHVGTTFQIDTVSTSIATVVGQLLIKLSYDIKFEIQDNVKASFSVFLRIGVSFITLLKGSLNGFLAFSGGEAIKLHGDILWLVAVFEGFGAFFGHIAGGLAFLIKAGVHFDLALLLGAASGIELFINLLFAIAARVDLAIFASFLNSTEAFFAIISQLGGNLSVGASGVFKVIAHIIGLIYGHVHIDVVIQTLIEFSASQSSNGSINLQVYWQGLVKVVEIYSASYNSSTQLSGFFSIVTNLQQGKLIVNEINISEIIETLAAGVQRSIQLSVTILFKISTVVKVIISIPSLFFKLLLYLESYYGIALLNKLGFKITISGSGSIIQQIFAGFSISTILAFIYTGFSLTAILPKLPVIGQIYAAFVSAVQVSSNGSVSFGTLLSQSGSIAIDLTAWLKGILNLGPKPTEPTTTKSPGGISGSFWSILGGGSATNGTSSGGISESSSTGGGISGSYGGGLSFGGGIDGSGSTNGSSGVTDGTSGGSSVGESSGSNSSLGSSSSGSGSLSGGDSSGGGGGFSIGGSGVSSGNGSESGSGSSTDGGSSSGSGSLSGGDTLGGSGGFSIGGSGASSGNGSESGSGSSTGGGSSSISGGESSGSNSSLGGGYSSSGSGSLSGGESLGGDSGFSLGGSGVSGANGSDSGSGSITSGGSSSGSGDLSAGGSSGGAISGDGSGSWQFGSGSSGTGSLVGDSGANASSSSGGSSDGGISSGLNSGYQGSLSWSARHKTGHKKHEAEKQHKTHHQV